MSLYFRFREMVNFLKNRNEENNRRDEVVTKYSFLGDIYMKKNKDAQTKVFCIDSKIPLWWLLDVVGSTTKIRAFTGVLVDNRK